MAKYKRYDYSQSVLIPVSLQEQLVPGTLEFAGQHQYFADHSLSAGIYPSMGQ